MKNCTLKASIIVALDSSKVLLDNFLYHLSHYIGIDKYEIIFINDKNELKFDESYVNEYKLKNIKIINSDKKLGYGVANNLASEYVTTKIIVFMNDDIILKQGCLDIIVEDIIEGLADAVQPKLIYPQTETIQSTGHVFTNYTNSHVFEGIDASAEIANINGEREALTTAVCATQKDLYFRMGKFDPIYFNAWEGMEYTLKLTLNGFKCLYDHRAEAYHLRGGSRSIYKLDEKAQSAIFWSRWSNKISEDLHKYYLMQLTEKELAKNYVILNFSIITDPREIIENSNICIDQLVSYTYNSGQESIDFFKTLPAAYCQTKSTFIYFCNNFKQVINNKLWYSLRKNTDIIMDLCGNILKVHDILPNSCL